MSQNRLLTVVTIPNHDSARGGTQQILIRRMAWVFVMTGAIALSAGGARAQSQSRDSRVWGYPVATASVTMPDGTVEPEPAGEWPKATGRSEMEFLGLPGHQPDVPPPQKTAIVGSWLGTTGEGNRLIATFNSDGTLHGSVQTEVSTNPLLGVLTPGHGVWRNLGDRRFGYTSVGVLYDISTGAYMGYLKARVLLTLNEAGDQLSGTDKVEIFGPDGNLLYAIPLGATSYTRIQFEPFD